jgi:hypothetical protein
MREVLRFRGGVSKAIMNPKPRITGDVARGSMKSGSRMEVRRPFGVASVWAASRPRTRAITRVAHAKPTELKMASMGGTKKTDSDGFSKSAR